MRYIGVDATSSKGPAPLNYRSAISAYRCRVVPASVDRVDDFRGFDICYRARAGERHIAVLLRSVSCFCLLSAFTYPISYTACGRVQVAQKLLFMLPPELASIGDPEVQATEYLHYRQFFLIWENLERIVECQSLEVPHMNKDTRQAWLQDYRVR